MICYVAEPLTKNYSSFWEDDETSDSQGFEYDYKEDWGEQLSGIVHPSLFLLKIESKQIYRVSGTPSDISVGQVTWVTKCEAQKSKDDSAPVASSNLLFLNKYFLNFLQ